MKFSVRKNLSPKNINNTFLILDIFLKKINRRISKSDERNDAMKKDEINENLLDMAMWHGVLEELDAEGLYLYTSCRKAEVIKEYSDDIIAKCLDLIEQEYNISKKPVNELDFKLDPMYSKAEHYRMGRQHGIDICKKVIFEYFGNAKDFL